MITMIIEGQIHDFNCSQLFATFSVLCQNTTNHYVDPKDTGLHVLLVRIITIVED